MGKRKKSTEEEKIGCELCGKKFNSKEIFITVSEKMLKQMKEDFPNPDYCPIHVLLAKEE